MGEAVSFCSSAFPPPLFLFSGPISTSHPTPNYSFLWSALNVEGNGRKRILGRTRMHPKTSQWSSSPLENRLSCLAKDAEKPLQLIREAARGPRSQPSIYPTHATCRLLKCRMAISGDMEEKYKRRVTEQQIMGKKKRRSKQKDQNKPQQEGAEPDDSNAEPITKTFPEADTPKINNSSSNGYMNIPSAIDNKDSLIPQSKEEQKTSQKKHEKELPNPESEIIISNISEGKNDAGTPDNVPEIPFEHKSQVTQPTTSGVIGLRVDNIPNNSVTAKVENNSSAEKSTPLKNVADYAGASEISHQQQIPKMNSTRPEGEESSAMMQISEERSSEKIIINVNDHGTLLNSSPESIIPSNNTHKEKPSIMPCEEEHKTTGKRIKEKPDNIKIPWEKPTELLDEHEGEYLAEKCSQNPNISVKLGPEESNTKIERDQTDSRQIAEYSISEHTTRQETKEDEEIEDLYSSCHTNLHKETKDNLPQELLPPEKDESVQHDSEQKTVSEGNSNEPIISSMTDSKKSNKKNKKGNVNKSKTKGKEDKPPLSSDCSELSKTEDTDQKEKIKNLGIGSEPKIIKKSDFKNMEENSNTREKTETPACKVQPVKENLKPTGGDIWTVKDQEINVTYLPTSEIKSSSQVIREEKDIEIINNIFSPKGTDSNQLKREYNTKVFANKPKKMKNCSLVCSSSSDERPDSQTISCSQSKDTEPVAESYCKEELEEKIGIQSSDLGIHNTETKYLINPSFKGNDEVGKKQPNVKSNDKSKNTAVKNPSHQQKTITDISKLNTQNQTVLDSFFDTNLNTMLSRNEKGASKQKKNDNKRNPTSNKKAEKNTSDEDKHEEVKNSEEGIKEDSESGSLQQTMKTINTNTKNSISNTEFSHSNENIINPGNAQESQAKLAGEGEGLSLLHTEGRVPARPIFMANTCHICKLTHGGSTRLQTCSACRLITYCSKEHQKKHWKEHKSICKVVQNMVRQRGLTDLFSNAHKITDADEWRKFRCILLTEAENYLDRALLPYEREMFLYPRTCGKCHRSDPEKLKVCKLCHYINFCCNEHIASGHHIWCQDLKLLLEINQYQSLYGLIKPFIPNFKLNERKPFPNDMKDFILNYVSIEKNFDLFNLYEATLSDVASYPLTVLYAINYLKERNFYTTLSNKLSIHLVGAESQFEADTISKWDAFLINLLPDVVKLNLVFIGPELTPNNTNRMNCGNYEKKNIKTIDPSKQLMTEFHYGKLYHEYAKEEIFTKPDIVCAFNCGIYRFTGFDKQDTWGPTMSSMLKYPNTPIILTAYTAVEAPKDVKRFQNQFKIEILHKTARNPFSSMRPNLNFVSDDETPVIYKNQYLSIIMKGD
ncbi:hypothetical protein J437_LFUL018087 [Ladona fulva]|uniref:MYND-type domain-containing protein n=1 Tax=Ladona fulva TaxID=123851 RepID=A0A8K0PC86_LADFU|nr:hypothetical protein J437_LFUL018087 [Ladona fulva]